MPHTQILRVLPKTRSKVSNLSAIKIAKESRLRKTDPKRNPTPKTAKNTLSKQKSASLSSILKTIKFPKILTPILFPTLFLTQALLWATKPWPSLINLINSFKFKNYNLWKKIVLFELIYSYFVPYFETNPFIVFEWTEEDVGNWLGVIGLEDYSNIFIHNKISGKNIFDLTDSELKDELKMSAIGHRKDFKKNIQQLKEIYSRRTL